ncbi:hypothetical protein CAEBREN_01331 [Caenorhabditis brenneri]|uniref:Condensin-2 complex subunit n=1 Tax=Caenorhabditis brenneri TaxID=135651 RepID=G0PBX3_CAEBE|nr:hypothetical protein CAEBREN_01331 [Caenorhabditis brenneri]
MATESDAELAECISTPLRPLNDIDDAVATSSSDCNYENYEEFIGATDMALFEEDYKDFLKELMKKTESILISGEKCDLRHVFEESGIASLKFNLFIWYFLENGKRPDSTEEEVELGALAASCYIAMCALGGSRDDHYQIGLYNLCLKIARNCCTTVRIGETVSSKKGGSKKKKSAPKPDETAADDDETEAARPAEAIIGPPRISVDSAEKYLGWLTTQFFSFLRSNIFSLDPETQMNTFEFIEEVGRLELDARNAQRACRANSIREFRTLEKFADRYCAFVHVLIESKYPSRRDMAFGRLIRPRLALMPYPDETGAASKISTERKRAGDLTVSLILARIARNPGPQELKLIETVLIMIYSQCPDLAEFRTNIAQFIHKILVALPYEYAYDFVQLMNVMFKGRTAGIKSLSNELANVLITSFDFSAPDPGPVPELAKESDSDVTEEEPEEEEEEAPAPQPDKDSEDEDDDSENDDDDGNKSRRRREKKRKEEEERKKKKKEKKAAEVKDVERIDAVFVLYNIVYMACLDRAAAMRLHGSHSLAKILDSPTHRAKFQEFCQVANAKMDEKLGEVGAELEDSMDAMNITGEVTVRPAAKSRKQPTDMLLNDQNILEKWNRLKKINKGEERVEKDIIYMLVRKLATDDKVPVKKSSCVLLKLYLSFCDEQVKFETVLSIIQKLCRDRMVSVRKLSAEAFTELMLSENVHFKETLSSNWLNSMISMLNDTDSDVVEHARKLIMRVLAPLLENPTDLTWTLLDTIERTTNHRNYLMTTLRDAVREKLIQKSVMDSMRTRILERNQRTNGAWMVFSQLCVQYHQHVDFVIEEFNLVDITQESELVKYMTHAIENNINKIDAEEKEYIIRSLRSTLSEFTLHASHARSLYYCLGKLMDGIGERAQNGQEFRDFGESLIVKCFDTIVQSFEMFKDRDEWAHHAVHQERLLCTSLNVVTEVVTFSPQLIAEHERVGKTLSMIIASNDGTSFDASLINPDMPSGNFTRPQTRMSEAVSSQKTTNGMNKHEGILFGENVRAVGVITLSNMIVAYDRLLKTMPTLVKQLQYNPSHQIRSNIVVSIGDICASYKTDRYAPMLAASLCDPSVIVRRHAINQIARLISLGVFRFDGEIMIRMMMATLDANEDVRTDAKLYISEVLQSEDPQFFEKNFVQYMIALTQARRRIGSSSHHHEEEARGGQIDVAIGGGQPLARASRIAIYTFMIESLNDRARFEVKCSICSRVFMAIINGEYDFKEHSVQCLLDDALLIMGSSEMQIKMEIGKDNNENVVEEPTPEQIAAAQDFMQQVYLQHYLNTIVPSVLALREFLNRHRSPLQRKCLLAIRMICLEHSRDIDKILQDNRQLKDEMTYELNRVKQRSEEAHRILNEAIQKVMEFNKRQKRQSMLPAEEAIPEEEPMEQAENIDVEMASPAKSTRSTAEIADESMRTPEKKRNPALDLLKTPGSALRSRTEERSTPQSRLLSPKTMKKIRRSVGALIQNDMCLNAPNLEETQVPDDQVLRRRNKTIEKEKTVVEEEDRMEHDGSPAKDGVPEEMPEEVPEEPVEKIAEEPMPVEQEQESEENTSRRRSRRRKTPNYQDESIDADGKVWKKPKIATKSPEKDVANISSNVTLRRSSRRGRPSTESTAPVVKKQQQKPRKRKASSDSDEEEQQVENTTPRDMTPLPFDESMLNGRYGRQCSTPIMERSTNNPSDMTFSLDLSAVTEKEELKNRKSAAYHLHNIFEEDEDEEN